MTTPLFPDAQQRIDRWRRQIFEITGIELAHATTACALANDLHSQPNPQLIAQLIRHYLVAPGTQEAQRIDLAEFIRDHRRGQNHSDVPAEFDEVIEIAEGLWQARLS